MGDHDPEARSQRSRLPRPALSPIIRVPLRGNNDLLSLTQPELIQRYSQQTFWPLAPISCAPTRSIRRCCHRLTTAPSRWCIELNQRSRAVGQNRPLDLVQLPMIRNATAICRRCDRPHQPYLFAVTRTSMTRDFAIYASMRWLRIIWRRLKGWLKAVLT